MTQGTGKPAFFHNGRSAALRITLIYLVVGCLWISLSDHVLKLLVPDVAAYARISTYKGWFFVLGTALLIYFLVDRALARAQRAEKGLHDSLVSYRELAESVSDVFLGLDDSLSFTYWNQPCAEITGIPAGQALGRGLGELFPDLVGSPLEEMLRRVLDQGRLETLKLNLAHQGQERYLEFRAYPAKRGLSLVVRDLTGSRRLDEERQRLSAALEQAAEGVAIWDPGLRLVYVNPAFAALHGRPREEWLGLSAPLLDSPRGQEIRLRVREQGLPWSGRAELRRSQGQAYLCEATITPVRDQEGLVINYVQVEHDVTQEVERETQMRVAQKMEAMGTLASGVAHDFNNVLAAIMGYSELATHELGPGHRAQAHLEQVIKAGERARDLVRQILAFSRQAEQRLEPLDLGQSLREGLSLLRATLPATVIMVPEIDPRPVMVLADPTEMQQVLMNLCANAAQAMGDHGGQLTISLGFHEVRERQPGLDLEPGGYALLTVADDGPGMTAEVRERVFEPFFTTKEVGRGTGLGLSVVHGIVRSSRGLITVDSSPGQGATFRVYLPLVAENARTTDRQGPEQTASQGERVLVVDDESALAELTGEMLARLGYRVRTATNALEALALFGQDPQAFDLVLSDLTMPLLSGLDLARRLHELRPGLPVMLTTGYGDHLTPEDLQEAGVAAVLLKPAPLTELARQLRRVLAPGPSGWVRQPPSPT
jgi:PAS domain S-box-containing protein